MATGDEREVEILRSAPDRQRALGELLDRHRRRLLKMVNLRMDPRLRARLGASDVLQDAFVEVSRRIASYLADPRMPFFLWLRFITAERLLTAHRRHLLAGRRDARREVRGPGVEPTTESLADRFAAEGTTPSEGALRTEIRARVMEALDAMEPGDRRVLALRHFEELSNAEAARELDITEAAASKRYLRALRRLRAVLDRPADDPDAPSR
jgi:RNA polymerase sigma-70 factor (ECF subfamily)